MNRLICQAVFIIAALAGGLIPLSQAQNLDQIGVTSLRAATTNLNGSGIRTAQPEASLSTDEPVWEVNPAYVNQPVSLFTYISIDGSTNTFPNLLSAESGHADGVGEIFYGLGIGVATNVEHVDNYDADFFVTNYVFALVPMPAVSVVNQSFTFGPLSISDQQGVDSSFDDYEEKFGTFFVSAVANGGPVCAPGTGYNCISTAAFGAGAESSVGPTIDNGRCKPDITAPGPVTSDTAPQVAGAAALLMQGALRGDGGGDTNSAFDTRTIKALLINGAVKPADWTNIPPSPLDNRYGAGVLNVFNAYEQLIGGKHAYIIKSNVTTNSPHLPTGATGTINVLNGWDFNTNSTTASTDGITHYYFNVTNGWSAAKFIFTATLVWNRQLGETNINDLDLFLYDAVNNNLIASSISRVDNVEHLWRPQLAQGRYDLQVVKNGGTNVVSDQEIYALAWAFVSPNLTIRRTGLNATLTWPAYPAGFSVETITDLSVPDWNTNNLPAYELTNSVNTLSLILTNNVQFFRLRAPNF